jgi:hypothetical protein
LDLPTLLLGIYFEGILKPSYVFIP